MHMSFSAKATRILEVKFVEKSVRVRKLKIKQLIVSSSNIRMER